MILARAFYSIEKESEAATSKEVVKYYELFSWVALRILVRPCLRPLLQIFQQPTRHRQHPSQVFLCPCPYAKALVYSSRPFQTAARPLNKMATTIRNSYLIERRSCTGRILTKLLCQFALCSDGFRLFEAQAARHAQICQYLFDS